MIYARAARFDVTRNFEKKNGFWGKLNEALLSISCSCLSPSRRAISPSSAPAGGAVPLTVVFCPFMFGGGGW